MADYSYWVDAWNVHWKFDPHHSHEYFLWWKGVQHELGMDYAELHILHCGLCNFRALDSYRLQFACRPRTISHGCNLLHISHDVDSLHGARRLAMQSASA